MTLTRPTRQLISRLYTLADEFGARKFYGHASDLRTAANDLRQGTPRGDEATYADEMTDLLEDIAA